jgi:hypothetical protein
VTVEEGTVLVAVDALLEENPEKAFMILRAHRGKVSSEEAEQIMQASLSLKREHIRKIKKELRRNAWVHKTGPNFDPELDRRTSVQYWILGD